LSGRARAAKRAIVDGAAGLVWAPGGLPKVVFDFVIDDDKIVEIDLVMDPDRVGEYEFVLLDR
jgi:RNA polymerase sigma-70 factor (ECF subfamily)